VGNGQLLYLMSLSYTAELFIGCIERGVRGGVKLPVLGNSYFFTESWQTIPTLKLRAYAFGKEPNWLKN
jgi:hypothetical protein